MKKIRSCICVMLALTVFLTLFGCSAAEADKETAASSPAGEVTAPALVKTVTEYTMDFETQEWRKTKVTEYTYENAYPVAILTEEIDSGTQSRIDNRYTFEGGVPTFREYEDETFTYTVEYDQGRVYHTTAQSKNGMSRQAAYYQYANEEDYFTFLLHEGHYQVPEGSEAVGGDNEEVDSVTVVSQNGLLVKTVNTGMYANWNVGDEKEWQRFNGTYTVEYDADGIAQQASSLYRAAPSGVQKKFDVTKKDGRVTEAVMLSPGGEEGDFVEFTKFTFEYSDVEISASRYATMINGFLMGEGNNYYQYLWY